ncbi:hypothetical protein D3C71_1748480 [compost metagenome]
MIRLSPSLFCLTAAIIPHSMPNTVANKVAPTAIVRVIGSLFAISSETGSPVRMDVPKSPVMACPKKMPNCFSSGSFSPSSSLACSITSFGASIPTIILAGSPGIR